MRRVITRHKMVKHFRRQVREGRLVYARDHERIEAEGRLDATLLWLSHVR